METTRSPREAFYAQTLEEMIKGSEVQAGDLGLLVSLGGMWKLRKSDGGCKGFVALDKLSFYRKRLMEELSRLRSWLATNEYATTQPLSEILMNWSGGSAALTALIEAALLCQHYAEQFEHEVPDLVTVIANSLND